MAVIVAGIGLALVLALIVPANARAQALVDEGRLIRLDPPSRVVTLDDGRMYRAVAGTAFSVDSRPETFEGLRPGVWLVVTAGEPVAYRRGRYIALPPVRPEAGVAVTSPPQEPAIATRSIPSPDLVPPAPGAVTPASAMRPVAGVTLPPASRETLPAGAMPRAAFPFAYSAP